MKKSGLVLLLLTMNFTPVNAEDCEPDVDLADSLDFEQIHVNCDKGNTAISNRDSLSQSKEKHTVSTYEAAATVAATKEGQGQTISDSADVIFNIREPFTLAGGVQPALNGLFAQMTHYCPQGWEKLKEWAKPSTTGYFLHYRFKCVA